MTDREEGYYFIKLVSNPSKWVPAYYDQAEEGWYTCGNCVPIFDDDTAPFLEFGPRIRTPDEWRKRWEEEVANTKKAGDKYKLEEMWVHIGRRDIIEGLMTRD